MSVAVQYKSVVAQQRLLCYAMDASPGWKIGCKLVVVFGCWADLLLMVQYCFRSEAEACLFVSGTSLLNAVNLIAYNVFYTSIPVSVSLVDKDLSEGTVMQHPQILYYCQAGRKLIFLNGIGEDAVRKLMKEDGHKGIVYELPRTLGYFDDHNFTKRSNVENAERARERVGEA
ncbi:Phospholipid-transporting ATPase 2 [Camellia lanceoleosa]|uniref:Phospholipid-transporting ATPase 2 n=1 Tax=Camellia lanceoleosa TaxID=1840588 RepID=A0ACC0FI60_9ERIC|nr:Phospholipid-transporting ATPase 2 [Camellia lanceoleosa]